MGISTLIQSDLASRVCCMEALMPGRIHRITPTTITPIKRFSQSESSILLPQFYLLVLLYSGRASFKLSDQATVFCFKVIDA